MMDVQSATQRQDQERTHLREKEHGRMNELVWACDEER